MVHVLELLQGLSKSKLINMLWWHQEWSPRVIAQNDFRPMMYFIENVNNLEFKN